MICGGRKLQGRVLGGENSRAPISFACKSLSEIGQGRWVWPGVVPRDGHGDKITVETEREMTNQVVEGRVLGARRLGNAPGRFQPLPWGLRCRAQH